MDLKSTILIHWPDKNIYPVHKSKRNKVSLRLISVFIIPAHIVPTSYKLGVVEGFDFCSETDISVSICLIIRLWSIL